MPITYEFIEGPYDIHTTFSDVVTLDELEAYFRGVTSDARFTGCRTELVEVDGVTMTGFDHAAIQRFSYLVGLFEGQLTATAVLAPADLPFGIGRMYQSTGDTGDRLQVFRDRGEAVAWLQSRQDDQTT